jgi:hypothetical protein
MKIHKSEKFFFAEMELCRIDPLRSDNPVVIFLSVAVESSDRLAMTVEQNAFGQTSSHHPDQCTLFGMHREIAHADGMKIYGFGSGIEPMYIPSIFCRCIDFRLELQVFDIFSLK